jgi:hypothetical protein
MDERMKPTTQLKLRPYRDWPSCDGNPRPSDAPAYLAKALERGTITVFFDPIASDSFPFSNKCDSPLFWEIAEPGSEGKYVCHHCVEVKLDGGLIAVGLETFPSL